MENLTNLFKLMELTRSQPQYGYALSGIQQDELSNLAEHHYLVTFIAWQLAAHVKGAGAKIDIQKVLEFYDSLLICDTPDFALPIYVFDLMLQLGNDLTLLVKYIHQRQK